MVPMPRATDQEPVTRLSIVSRGLIGHVTNVTQCPLNAFGPLGSASIRQGHGRDAVATTDNQGHVPDRRPMLGHSARRPPLICATSRA
jgi:hypothetical protein